MLTLSTIDVLRGQVSEWRGAGVRIGFVPTMGALHAGHEALLQAARRDCDKVAASIFVNPIQFNSAADLANYPSDLADDLARLRAAGCDLLYLPEKATIYPPGFATSVAVPGLSDCLCGLHRPGHMNGVATVVAKLFLQLLPDVAYFGEKDYQQLVIVRRMARDLDIPVEVAAVETVREADGLALSSRNRNLSEAERATAPRLHGALSELAPVLADGRSAEPLLEEARQSLLGAGFTAVDYLDLRAEETLATLERAEVPCRLFVAATLGATRLIDNLRVI